jgi:hypothetical protein
VNISRKFGITIHVIRGHKTKQWLRTRTSLGYSVTPSIWRQWNRCLCLEKRNFPCCHHRLERILKMRKTTFNSCTYGRLREINTWYRDCKMRQNKWNNVGTLLNASLVKMLMPNPEYQIENKISCHAPSSLAVKC